MLTNHWSSNEADRTVTKLPRKVAEPNFSRSWGGWWGMAIGLRGRVALSPGAADGMKFSEGQIALVIQGEDEFGVHVRQMRVKGERFPVSGNRGPVLPYFCID
jgi:hypothetical protein